MPISVKDVTDAVQELAEREDANPDADRATLIELGYEPEAADRFFRGDPVLEAVGKGIVLGAKLRANDTTRQLAESEAAA